MPTPETARRGQPGSWWVINTAPSASASLYWEDSTWRDGRPMCSFDPCKAAQFDSKESAEFQAQVLGLPERFGWQAEEHGWS